MDDILENVSIDGWADAFSRDDRQVNAPHESDAELMELPDGKDMLLAASIDTVSEEVREGIYRSPFTMGWVAAMASLSDLAAVGADALGLLLSVSLPSDGESGFVAEAARGVEEACRSVGTHVLGGDLNHAAQTAFTGCALGIVPRGSALTRRGLQAGDGVYLSGPAGAGNALGLVRLTGLPESRFSEETYRPEARLTFGRELRGLAHACMDTSDGVLATADQLMRLNGLGFEIDCDWDRILAPRVMELCDSTGTPPWLMLAGPHGEFQLLFSIPEARMGELETRLAKAGQTGQLVRVGRVHERPAITLRTSDGERREIDMAQVRNLLESKGAALTEYVAALLELGREWDLER